LKFFRGALKLIDPVDLLYNNALDPVYTREAWGALLGYTREKSKFKIILFKAGDQADSIIHDSIKVFPKENTVISGAFELMPHENISIKMEHAISAFTENALAPRVDIHTPQSVHNMLGLFEKKVDSDYYNAFNGEIAFQIGTQKIGYIFESVDKNYRALGTLFFDNNFIDHRLFGSGIWNEKLTYSASLGSRKNRITQDTVPSNSKLIFQSTASYQWSDQFNTYGSFNNLKTVQQEYYRSFQSNTVDSISLEQINSAFTLGSNYQIGTEAPLQINVLLSTQKSNGIKNEEVTNSDNQSHIISVGYNQQFDKLSLQGTFSYISTNVGTYKNETWQTSFLYGYTFSDKIKLNTNFQYQSIKFGSEHINQLIQRNILDLTLTDRMLLRIEAGIEISDSKNKFQVDRVNIRLDTNYKL
jgi:hypothetical protein